nr:MAG TPA: hypothetical protein [Caudoviricetes sp.]
MNMKNPQKQYSVAAGQWQCNYGGKLLKCPPK